MLLMPPPRRVDTLTLLLFHITLIIFDTCAADFSPRHTLRHADDDAMLLITLLPLPLLHTPPAIALRRCR